MTSEPLFDALEICLQALDQGETVESCLVRYPALAEDLRPILIAALEARTAAALEVPVEVARRGKARVLQAAAEMREQRSAAPVLPFWRRKGFFGARFYRLAVTTALVLAFLLTGGTGLVNASNGALPGDQLYPVKRGWEGLRLVLIFDEDAREELEHRFEQERVQEIEELYTEKRFEQVNFQGVVQSQQADLWIIDGLKIAIETETIFQGEIPLGALVQVVGETDDGLIEAEKISLISAPQSTPTLLPTMTPAAKSALEKAPETQEKPEATESPEMGGSETQESGDSEKPAESTSSATEKPETESSYHPTETPRPGQSGSGEEENSDHPTPEAEGGD